MSLDPSPGSAASYAPPLDDRPRGWRGLALVALATFVVALAAPLGAHADEPVLLSFEGAVAMPVTSPTFDRFGAGGLVSVAGAFPVTSYLVPTLRLRTGFLSDGGPPADSSLHDPGVGLLSTLTAGLRFRPRGIYAPAELQRANDLWIELAAGGALTGDLVRPVFDVGIGYAFEIDDVRLGPVARFIHVLHFDDAIDSSSAHLVTLGLEVVLFDRRGGAAQAAADERAERDDDVVPAAHDRCPGEPEDEDGFEDDDGCPDLDNDRDGIPDVDDACPNEPEDRDDWEDADGCPDPDNDRDGFLDAADACPNDAEVVNGVQDEDGCPDAGLIQMREDRIVIEETVLFDLNRARVKHSARPVLEAIVALWRQHPEWERVRVEGHADARGEAEWNQELSEMRATRVRAELVELGMPAEMIEVVGHGAARPRDARRTEEGYQRNRRVEFVVVARRHGATSGGGR